MRRRLEAKSGLRLPVGALLVLFLAWMVMGATNSPASTSTRTRNVYGFVNGVGTNGNGVNSVRVTGPNGFNRLATRQSWWGCVRWYLNGVPVGGPYTVTVESNGKGTKSAEFSVPNPPRWNPWDDHYAGRITFP